jgi:hypothetical protein
MSAKKVYTITFGDVAENHARMQKIGTLAEHGFSTEQLRQLQSKFPEDVKVELLQKLCEMINKMEIT